MGMSMVRVTFTLDEATVAKIASTAARRGISMSQVVREFVAEGYRMGEEEHQHKLRVLRAHLRRPDARPQAEVDREIQEIRRSRRRGWHRPSDG